jgi:PKD repeat protein
MKNNLEKYVKLLLCISFALLFFITNSSSQNPLSVEGIQVWLRADTNITISDGKVSEWISNDPFSQSFSQSINDFMPQWNDSIEELNNFPVVYFDGIDDILICNSSTSIGSSYIVLNYDGGLLFTEYSGAFTGTGNEFLFVGSQGSTNLYETGIFTTNIEINKINSLNAGTLVKYKQLYGFTNSPINIAALQIGKDRFSSTRYWKGSFAEILVYDHSLSNQEKETVDKYLKNRYAQKLVLPDTINVSYGFCDTTIIAPDFFSNYLWSTGDTTNFTTCNREGYIYLTVKEKMGFSIRDSIFIDYPIEYPNQNFICEVSSTPLVWNAGVSANDYSFNWSNSETDDEIILDQLASYFVTITDTLGCTYQSDTITTVFDDFSTTDLLINEKSICVNEPITFVSDINSIQSILWSTNDTLQEIKPQATGVYSVIVINQNNCIAKDTIIINIIGTTPETNFSTANFCSNQAIFFSDSSIIQPEDEIILSFWNFGDGETGVGSSSEHIYDSAGMFEVTHTLYTLVGCTGTFSQTIIIYPSPNTDFTVPPICSGTSIYFEDISITPDSGFIESWQWNLDNGTTLSGLSTAVTSYPFSGVFNVQLITGNSYGCTDSITKEVLVDQTPIPQFNFSGSCFGNVSIFTNTTDETLTGELNYYWSFGDSSVPSTEVNPTHLFQTPFNYFILLTATSSIDGLLGCIGDTVVEINIFDSPQAAYNNSNLCDSSMVTFTDNSIASFGDTIIDNFWSLNGVEFFNQNTVDFLANNIQEINLFYKITSLAGCSDSLSNSLSVNPIPLADFSFTPEIGSPPLEVNFQNFGDTESNYFWLFGDGGISDLFEPTYTYLDSGIYLVELNVSTEFGCQNSAVKTIKIVQPITDIAIVNAYETTNGNFIRPSFLISNNGNNLVENFFIDVSANGGDKVREEFSGILPENGTLLYEFTSSLFVEYTQQNYYYCGEVSEPNGALIEINYENNTFCKSVNTTQFSMLGIYPNPFNESMQINFSIPKLSPINVDIIDATGRIIQQFNLQNLFKGFNKFVIETSNLSDGIYNLKINYNNENFVFPIVKLN